MAPLSYSAPAGVTTQGMRRLSTAAAPGMSKMSTSPTFSQLSPRMNAASPRAGLLQSPGRAGRPPPVTGKNSAHMTSAAVLANPMAKQNSFTILSSQEEPTGGATRNAAMVRRSSFSSVQSSREEQVGRAPRSAATARRDSFSIQSSRGPKVVCYGDSLTAGFTCGGSRFTPYGAALRQDLAAAGVQCDVKVCGLTGHTAQQMLQELDAPRATDQCGGVGKGLRYMIKENPAPELVVIMAGTNDLGVHRDVAEIFRDICALHAACHACGVATLCVSPPHYAKRSEQARLTQLLRKWVQEKSLVKGFVDIDEFLPQTNRQFWDFDKLHCSSAGYQQLGRQLSYRIAKILDAEDARSPPRKVLAVSIP